jgi:dihydrofolate reductase
MGKVSVGLSMSLDGFIAGPNDGPDSPLGDGGERLFAWYSAGDTEYRLPGTEMVFEISTQSAELLREAHSKMGAFVTGRRTFDIANGWGGNPPLGVPRLTQNTPAWGTTARGRGRKRGRGRERTTPTDSAAE